MDKKELLKNSRSQFNPLQRFKLSKAIDYATKKHLNQKRLSGEPYITHPLAVAAILLEWRADLDTVIAGILHDTIEDTDTSLAMLEKLFDKQVAYLVDGVTKVTAARKGMRNISTYQPQTRDNLTKLLLAISRDARVVIIKLADRLHNLRTLEYQSLVKQQKIALESLEVFARLADRLGMGMVRVEMEEIAFSYLEPKRYNYLKKLTKKRISKAHARFEKIKSEVSHELGKNKIKHKIDGRIKSLYSLHKKLQRYDENIEEVYDLLALRIIVKDKDECYRVLGLLHHLYTPNKLRIKDYIASPKANGYQSLHTTIQTSDGQMVEFQVRSKMMHDFAEEGLAASFHYHEQKSTKQYLLRRPGSLTPQHMRWIQQLRDLAKPLESGVSVDELSADIFGDRIFVTSPKGDIYDLPEGALPLDFAYAVHSDVGNSAKSFLVNNHMRSFNYILQNGDHIEVLRQNNGKPKPGWLNLVKTNKARQKIKAELSKT